MSGSSDLVQYAQAGVDSAARRLTATASRYPDVLDEQAVRDAFDGWENALLVLDATRAGIARAHHKEAA